jgi:serine protease Do
MPRAAASVLALLLTAPLGACSTGPAQAHTGPESFAPIVQRVLPAVVNISVTESVQPGEDPLAGLPPQLQRQFRNAMRNRRQEVQGAGSGFIIDPAGYIVTNNHVVQGADRIVVSLPDGTHLEARVVGVDDLTDVALIKVDAPHPLPAVSFGSSHDVQVGDWVLAAGNPYNIGGSVTAGIVSARGRNIGEGPFDDFIQLDAPINPGNSGGPVFDESGQVVGMNTAIVSPTGGSVGIGFAIPAEIVSRIVADLRRNGRVERGWIGVAVPPDEDQPPGQDGVQIDTVDPRSPAQRAGLRAGDLVEAVDGQGVDNANALIKAIADHAPGATVHMTVRRGSRDLQLSVTVGRRPDSEQ